MSRRCEICKSMWLVGRHHKFPQTKWARKLYGKLIDHPKNIQYACGNCHGSHKSDKLIHWTELEFCQVLGIAPRSKTSGFEGTSDRSILKRYKKAHNPEELEGTVRPCRCGQEKNYRHGRFWTPCKFSKRKII